MRIYFAGEGDKDMMDLLGGKGANLQEMYNLGKKGIIHGLEVPPFFTITADVCREYFAALDKRGFIDELVGECRPCMARLESMMGKSFGGTNNALLVSVRSGASVSMPGMMDSVLNVGLSDSNFVRLPCSYFDDARCEAADRFARDSYLTLQRMFDGAHQKVCFSNPDARDAAYHQLRYSIESVFKSSRSRRALDYKKKEGLAEDLGTAVNIQAMVFGNLGSDSATGVVFTRNNATGAKSDGSGARVLYGDWCENAQGDDVVSGSSHTRPISELKVSMPSVYSQLESVALALEEYYKDMQDVEFTVERGRLWFLQTRGGKRSSRAKLVCAVDMVDEKLISKEEAVYRFLPSDMEVLLHPVFDPKAPKTLLSEGLNAGPGEVSGVIALSPEHAVQFAEEGKDVILIREKTSPEDVHGMFASRGIYTMKGGLTSHAAIVGKQHNKAVVAGDSSLQINLDDRSVIIGGKVFKEGGHYVSISGTTGKVYEGIVPTVESEIERVAKQKIPEQESEIFRYFKEMLSYAKSIKNIGVRVNAETGEESLAARVLGAEGIGLLRTEHTMFGDDAQIFAMREMILADDGQSRERALLAIEPVQIKNYIDVFEAMDGLPITIRLLDPPLDEFLPDSADKLDKFVVDYHAKYGGDKSAIRDRVVKRMSVLSEPNPMIGFRGNRLSVVYPEITKMQARSIFEAMYRARRSGDVEIMVPVTICAEEIKYTKGIVDEVRADVDRKYVSSGFDIGHVPFGTMIETPRAAILAGSMGRTAEFFSFGTNDLTQLTYAMDRGASGLYLGRYLAEGLLPVDPFVSIDKKGVGKLVEDAVSAAPGLKFGVCGEQGADPESIRYFRSVGVHYVSCGTYKVPVAVIAAAHSELKN